MTSTQNKDFSGLWMVLKCNNGQGIDIPSSLQSRQVPEGQCSKFIIMVTEFHIKGITLANI